MNKKFIFGIAAAAIFAAGLSVQPLMAEKGPCVQDVQRLCPNATGKKERRQCMRENKDQLSEACKARVRQTRDKMKQMNQACKADRQQFCKGIRPGEGRIRACFVQNQAQLSQQCRDALPEGFLDRNPPPEVEGDAL